MAVNPAEGASPPVFEQIFRNARFAQGGNALFEGKVKGNPRPQVVWTRKGLQMKPTDKHQMVYDENSGKVSLMIKAIGPGDEGEYTCTALNPYGEAICTVYISPEATKSVKKSKSGAKLHKSGSNKQIQMAQQQQQMMAQQQQQTMMATQQQSSFSSSMQQSSMSSSSSFHQESSAAQMMKSSQMSSSSMQVKQQSSSSSSTAAYQQQQQTLTRDQDPEVIYLKHVERSAQQQQRREEEVSRYGPPSFMTPLNDLTIMEGEKAHLDAKVGPVGDPSIKVEWYCNGQVITASSRVNTTCQFGFVSLDMLNTTVSDSGEYTCVVSNDAGSVQSSSRVQVQARKEIETDFYSQGIRQVEMKQESMTSVHQQKIEIEAKPAKPEFVKPLNDLGDLGEGSNVHLEAQVNPVSDHTMAIEWFKDGKAITASSRIGTLYSFGYVSLNITGVRMEDAGTYVCVARNASGEASTQASVQVIPEAKLTSATGIAEQQVYIEKVQQLEQFQASKSQMSRMESVVEPAQPPQFTTPLQDQLGVREGGFAHFEARLEPMGDHSMSVEWFKDGRPVDASSRITCFFNFGYVALTIKQVSSHDAGVYTCVARNAKGQVQTEAQLTTVSKVEGDFQSKSFSAIQQMEMSKTTTQIKQESVMVQQVAPKFVSQLKGTSVILEGQHAHFECRLEPQNDPSMKVEWIHNGKALSASSRIQTHHDFGYVALDIMDVKKEDGGTYVLVASNALGRTEAKIDLRVDSHAQVVDTTTMHAKTLEETKRFEMKQTSMTTVQQSVPEVSKSKPVFVTPLQDAHPTSEGQNIHLEARLEPIGDPSIKVEWFCNGRPLTIGSRFKTYNDFGFIALDIVGVDLRDAGNYICRASNQLGQAETSANVTVIAKSNVITETEHEAAMQQISFLESHQEQRMQMSSEMTSIQQVGPSQPPKFIKPLKAAVETVEGQAVHLEARLSPTGDSTMKVEWTVNGKPLKTGHKIKPQYDFDFVALDLLSVYPEDSGTYTCTARNALGEATTSATVKIAGGAQIVTESSSQMSQFQQLEARSHTARTEVLEEQTTQAPVFTSSMKSIEVKEGQRAHFECRIIPVSDPTLKVEWMHNGNPLKQGTRFREGLDFGFVYLDIMHVYPEDAGTYTLKATNVLGQAVNSADLNVRSKETIVKETMHAAAVEQIAHLEQSSVSQVSHEEGFTTQAPAFTSTMRDVQLMEGTPAHFEAKLVPIGDPKLRVDWLKNGKPIQASNRMSSLHDFGFVALDLKYTRPDDTGNYTCRATNELGEANISANLKVLSAKDGPQAESLHGEALGKIANLEKKTRGGIATMEDVEVVSAPNFVVALQGKTNLIEGQNLHVECRIDPYPDATLNVEWYLNDKPLPFGNRWRTSYDFGFAALDIIGAYAEDSGRYTLKATNALGQAESHIEIKIAPRSGLLLDSDHVDALDKIRYLESKHQRTAEEELAVAEAPQFGHGLKDLRLDEGQPAHFETTLTPVNDASMTVEWLFNGKAVPQGHRFRTTYDFGFVALDILYAYPEDSGTYTCRAKNNLGETNATSNLIVQGKSGLLLDTMDRDRLHHLKNLESHKANLKGGQEAEAGPITKPVFTTALQNAQNVPEQRNVHLECRLEPLNDPNLKVEWFVNGKAIKMGHRFRTTHDFGFVSLDILGAYTEDSGTYMCKASNNLGEAVNTCSVEVVGGKSLMLDSQHPEGWEKVKQMEKRSAAHGRLEVEDMPVGPPHFVTDLMGQTSCAEGQIAHFEAQIEPIHDSDLSVEFIHNGQPLKQASRIHTLCDFGYVALDIGQLITADSGTYTCKVKNKFGEAASSISLSVAGHGSLDTSSVRPEGLEKIKALETKQSRLTEEEMRTFQKPVFTQPLKNLLKEENTGAHFNCTLIPVGDPTMKVEWFKDGQLVSTGTRINTMHDFGLVNLDINGVRSSDDGIYEVRATNSLGEAMTTASLKVVSKGSLILDSQHPEGMRKITALESSKTARSQTGDAEQQFDKPIFVETLKGSEVVAEGQQAHMECRVEPVGDPNLKFTWLKNGEPLKMGSRFHATQDFGFVTLDIQSCVAEDSGMYTVKATNMMGDASSSLALHVGGQGGVMGDALHPDSYAKIQALEAQKRGVKQQVSVEDIKQPPVFMEPLRDVGVVAEGSNVVVEARIEPKNDSNLKVEWELNGKAIETGSRLKTSLDFGHVVMQINGARASDSGLYTCKAINALGEAVSTTSIKVEEQPWNAEKSQNPTALEAIQAMEARKAALPEEMEVTDNFNGPTFTTHINDVICDEEVNVRFECSLEPKNDPNMKIDWQLNGKPMSSGTRIVPTADFGVIALDIQGVQKSDAGVVTCIASNQAGQATTSGTLKVNLTGDMISATQHPAGQSGLANINKVDGTSMTLQPLSDQDEEMNFEKPIFTTTLPETVSVLTKNDGILHLECNVEPKTDPNLKINWCHNGEPLNEANRIMAKNDFGFVTLDIRDLSLRDSGVYTCKATNNAGEAVAFTTVTCDDSDGIDFDTKHPRGKEGLEAISKFEAKMQLPDADDDSNENGEAPNFVQGFENVKVTEGDRAYFEAQLEPKKDSDMVLNWSFNGKPLVESSRYKKVHSFGMVILEIGNVSSTDAGIYTCTATNQFGTAMSSTQLNFMEEKSSHCPKFMGKLEDHLGLKDGQSVHMQVALEPVNDPDLKVEWFWNDQPLPNSSRLKTVADFGYVMLDIAGVDSRDSGKYTCRAWNKYGEDTVSCQLQCEGKSGVQLQTLHPDALDKIARIELTESGNIAPAVAKDIGPPKFVSAFNQSYETSEGQSTHLEARLTPVEDPNLKVEWFKDGKPLPTGHRFRTFHDFGIVILDILYCYAEDSGTYECKATNKLGSDSISCTIKCSEKSGLILTPQVPGEMKKQTIERIQHLESMKMRSSHEETITHGVAPRFTVPIENMNDLKEGENAHFEARLIPTDDPTMTIEWYWNGKALKAGSRIRTFCDFGFVILEISPVYPEDSGEYTCKAKNALGEAVTTATLKCSGKRGLIMDSQLPRGMEGAMDKIANLEGLGNRRAFEQPSEDADAPPEFLSSLEDLLLAENTLAHFETRLTPINDPSMRVEWFHNGKQLSAGSRIKTINDFGFVILEVASVMTRDSGNYTCKAVNKHGEASVACNVQVKGKQSIITDPQLPRSFKTGTDSINRLEENKYRRDHEFMSDEVDARPPVFVSKIRDVNCAEGQPAHFDCRVEPIGDGSMRVEWFHNDQPIQIGSRIHTISDFGFVVLDIDWTFKRDSGRYTCRAINRYGTAETTATLNCSSKQDINLDSQLPSGMSLSKLKDLEKGKTELRGVEDEAEITAPKFITQLQSRAVAEGEPVHFSCRVEPKHDPKLQVSWFHKEKELQFGSRFRITYEFGYVALDILYTYPEDEGEYVCKAKNDLGEDITKCKLVCKELPAIQLENQVPKGMKKSEYLMQMEASMKKYAQDIMLTEDDVYDIEKRQPPRFVTQIQSVTDLVEMQATKFECQLAPVGDPNMKVEWFFNGKALPFKNRFTPIYDFGYVAMNFGWVYPEDSGEYLCRATNAFGMDETRGIIKTSGKPGIIYESQLPRGMASIEQIRKMESGWQRAPDMVDTETERFKPCFVTKPEPQEVCEGEVARFCCRVTGHPKPRVMWLLNGHTVINGSKHKLVYDGMWHFDIPKCRDIDGGKVEVIARNSCGEAYSATTLAVNPRQDDYRAVLKHNVKRDYVNSKEYRKPEWVTRMEEIQKKLDEQTCSAKFTSEIKDLRVKEGQKAKFECAFAGNPPPDVVWEKDGKVLENSKEMQIKVKGGKTSLTIAECAMDMSGYFTVKIKNPLGSDRTRSSLTVSKPGAEKEKITKLVKSEESKAAKKTSVPKKPEPKPAAVKKPEPAKPEPAKPAKTWGKAGSKTAEPPKEPEKKEEVSLKKTEPQPKKEEEKKVETPALKPTPKSEKEPQEESKETVQLKAVKKEAKVENDKKVIEPQIKQADQTPMPKTEDIEPKLKPKQEEITSEATIIAETPSDKTVHSQKEHEDIPSTTKPDDNSKTQTQVDKPQIKKESESVKLDDKEPIKTTEEIEQQKDAQQKPTVVETSKTDPQIEPKDTQSTTKLAVKDESIKSTQIDNNVVKTQVPKMKDDMEGRIEEEDKEAIHEKAMETKEASYVQVESIPDKDESQRVVEAKGESANDTESNFADKKIGIQEVINEREEVKIEVMGPEQEVEKYNDTLKVTNTTVKEIKEKENEKVVIDSDEVREEPIEISNKTKDKQEEQSSSQVTTKNILETEWEGVKEEIKMTTDIQECQSPEKPEPVEPAKTWGKAGSKKAEIPKEPEKKEKVSLKKVKPQQKKEEEKKIETPALKPTPKSEKETQEESKETVQLKAVKKEAQNIDDVRTQDDQQETKSNILPKKKKKKVRMNVEENIEKSNKDEVAITAEEEITDTNKEESYIPFTQESPKTSTHSDVKEQSIDTTQVAQQAEAPKVEEAPKKPAPAPKKMPTAAAPAPSADELDTGMKKATEGTEKDKVPASIPAEKNVPKESDMKESVEALSQITERLRKGSTVAEVQTAFEANEFPALKRKTSQMALLAAVERSSKETVNVEEIIAQDEATPSPSEAITEQEKEVKVESRKKSLAQIGLTAFMATAIKEPERGDEIISSLHLDDFTEAQAEKQYARIVCQSTEMDMAQAIEVSSEIKESLDVAPKEAGISEVPQMAVASAKQTETQASAVIGETLSAESVQALNIQEGDVFFALATFVSETGEAMNLVEGEKVHVLEWNNADWWYVRKHLTEESGWVPAQYLKDEQTYTMYVQKKLVEKIEKLPVFDKPKDGENSFAPKVLESVKNMSAADGSTVEFVCKVEGSPRPQITWFRQTAIIKPSQDFQIFYYDDDKATLVIKEVFPEDAGTFTCVAKNCVGFASSSAELIVEHPISEHGSAALEKHDRRSISRESSLADIVEGIPPTFAQRPQTKICEEGQSTELECRFVAIPEAEVQWFHNKTLLQESSRVSIENQADMHMYCSIVRISNVEKNDEGTYEVSAKNREGEATNTLILNVTLKPEKAPSPVNEPPIIVKQLTPTVCKLGDSVKLETVITGTPTPKIEWAHNGTVIQASSGVKVMEKDNIYSLVIDNVDQTFDGDYTVKADNASGSVTTKANLTVQGQQVEFVTPLEDIETKEKSTVEMNVETSAEETDVKWYKDGEQIKKEANEQYEFKKVGRKHSLIIKDANVHIEGEYSAVVGDEETSCELTVVELPATFTKKISNMTVTAGEQVIVFETELSKGDAVTKWYKNGTEIKESDRFKMKIDGKCQRLEIHTVETSDAGEYLCTIGNEKCTATLTVEEPKVNFVEKLPDTTSGETGQDIELSVKLSNDDAEVKWFRDGSVIEASEKITTIVDKASRKHSIVIKGASIEDVAEYTCQAENVTSKTELEVKSQEEKIEIEETTKEQVGIKGQDITFSVNFKQTYGSKPAAKWLFNSQELTESERLSIKVTRKCVTLTIKQVEQIDCGSYSVKISNNVSEVSADFSLSIKDKPSPPKGPAEVEWRDDNTMVLKWNASESDGGASITEYVVERREVGKKSWKQVGTTTSNITHLEIKGLKKNSSYNFRISAKNSVGLSQALKMEETVTRPEVKASAKGLPGSPSVSVTGVTSKSVTLNWSSPINTGGVELTGYIIEKRISTTHKWEKAATVDPSVTQYTIENLKEKSEFYFRVSAENEVGASEPNNTEKVALRTSARPPTQPTAPLEIVALGPHSIMVEWGAPESDGGAPLEGYKVAVRDAKRHMWMEVGRVAADVQKLKVQELAEGNLYHLRIYARNEVGFSDPLENEEPFKVVRPADYNEEEAEEKRDEMPSLSFSTTETLSSWMREANVDADIQSYTKSTVLRRDEYFFRIWYYASKLFEEK